MPIYEWNCVACDLSFEALASVAEANAERACPECGDPAARIISACIIGVIAPPQAAASTAHADRSHHHGHTHGRRSPIPEPARLCWMDDKSAERLAAYKTGRGHEYDDKQAVAAERRKQRGEIEPKAADDAYSPVKVMLARKKAKEAAVKAAVQPAGAAAAPVLANETASPTR
ncbi:MAG TPA: zinc ribbon domain-containing protein [Candidatus Binataceae bacterium]|nr:zinc ribbon domain-containing protein [Candidatus Binataceae bacterium]